MERTYRMAVEVGNRRINGTYNNLGEVEVEITIDEDALARFLAETAASNSSGHSRTAEGSIRCRIVQAWE